MSSHKRPHASQPSTSPKQCIFKIVGGFLCCRLVENLTRSTLDGPRKRYIKEWKVYRQYMDDQERQEREEQKTFKERLRDGVRDLFNVQKRLRRHRYAVRQGSPPPRQPPCCPHWDKTRPKASKCRKQPSKERLRVYEPGQKSRLERYEERLRDPTSKEARQKAAFEARFNSKTTTVSDRPAKIDTEMERVSQRIRDIDRRNAMLVEASGVKLSRTRQDQPGKNRHPTEGPGSGARSLGTVALKGRDAPKNISWE